MNTRDMEIHFIFLGNNVARSGQGRGNRPLRRGDFPGHQLILTVPLALLVLVLLIPLLSLA